MGMSSEDSVSREEKLFKIALDTRNFEISLFWQRSNYFLVLNSALAAGFFSLKEPAYATVLASLGAIASLLWALVNLGGKYWHSRWEHELEVRERKLYPDDPMFAASRQQTDRYVRESLLWNGSGILRRWIDRLIVMKPSVSGMITILSGVFCLTWTGLLVQRLHGLFALTWPDSRISSITTPSGFAVSAASSLAVIGVIYTLYMASAAYARRKLARAECRWLPSAGTFYFVIRSASRTRNLSGIRYRTWFRKIVPLAIGTSVAIFLEDELTNGERLFLPAGEDQAIICFRFEAEGSTLNFTITDKLGSPIDSRRIDDENIALAIEFSARVENWVFFKHQISRLYSIPHYRLLNDKHHDTFREDILPMQRSDENRAESLLRYAEAVTTV